MNKYLIKIAKELPYRDRVEVVILKGDKVLVMNCRNPETGDKWFAFPGGGVDGQDEIKAAENECLEEVGVKVKNIKATKTTFKEEGGMSKKDDRHLKYRGSKTRWYIAEYDGTDQSKRGDDGDSRKYSFKSIQEALQDVKSSRGISTPRQEVLKALKGSNRFLEKAASLEKNALNAFKARAMAKKVGVIPVTKSKWKLALSKLRNSSGDPLRGRELSEAKSKLGSLSNNSIQYMDSVIRKHGPGIDTKRLNKLPPEVLAKVDRSLSKGVHNEFSFKKVSPNDVKGFRKGIPGAVKSIPTQYGTVHTHPISSYRLKARPFSSSKLISSSPSRADVSNMKSRSLINRSQNQYHNIYAPYQQTESVSKIRTHGDKVIGATTIYFDRSFGKARS